MNALPRVTEIAGWSGGIIQVSRKLHELTEELSKVLKKLQNGAEKVINVLPKDYKANDMLPN